MKKILVFVLALVTAFSLAACGNEKKDGDVSESVVSSVSETKEESKEESSAAAAILVGKWAAVDYVSEEHADAILQYFSFTAEERAFADLSGIGVACTVEFTPEGRYAYAYDADETRNYLKNYYNAFIKKLYENAEALTGVYGDDILSRCENEEAFKEFYTYMFDKQSYDELLDHLASETMNYNSMSEPVEQGTYSASMDGTIDMTADGSSQTFSVGYEVSGDTLKLKYSDGEEIYTKVK